MTREELIEHLSGMPAGLTVCVCEVRELDQDGNLPLKPLCVISFAETVRIAPDGARTPCRVIVLSHDSLPMKPQKVGLA